MGGWGIFLFLYPCFGTRTLSCGMQKKANYFSKEKKKPKYFLVSLFYPLHKWRNEKWEQLIFQVFTRNSTTMKRKEEMLLDPKVCPWISLKKVSVLIDQDLPRLLRARCCLFIQRLTSVCTENGLSRPILLGSNVNADW